MDSKDIRWKQRFQNFEKAFFKLRESLEEEDLNELERNGVVKRFEFTFELGWKTLKDYMQEQGMTFQLSPKGTFRHAQQSGLMDYAQILIDALEVRNDLVHDYDGEKFEASENLIREEIFPALEKLYNFFLKQVTKD